MLKQAQFESAHRPLWQRLRQTVDTVASTDPRKRADKADLATLPELYVEACNHLSMAKARGYSPALCTELHELVIDTHPLLYQHKSNWFKRTIDFLKGGFPELVREHYKLFWLSTALFYLPAIVCGLIAFFDSDFIYRVVDPYTVMSVESMYQHDANYRPTGRESSSDFQMFGFYIANNIGIDFRVFAGGVLFGLGTLFFLLFNGLFLGSIAGHLTGLGYTETFWGFVAGHSAFELTALVISGMSGLLIGWALVKPGRFSRVDALKINAQIAVKLVIGAAIMTLAAAFVEGYWSSSGIDTNIKYVVGVCLWALTIAYLLFAGRNSARESSMLTSKRSSKLRL